eukprot:Skav217190  [mRNA]  locus=scaffold557:65483:69174:+ [translate_table: standard]
MRGGRGGGGGGGFRDDGGGGGGGRSKGAILKYDEEKGFGFIKPDRGNEDIFVHFSSLPREYQRGGGSVLQPGDRVIFDNEMDPKKGKPCAKNVQIEGGGGGGYGAPRGGGGGGGGRAQGSVSNWDGEKGFGFIAPDGGDKDLFVHFSSLPRSYQRGGEFTLAAGDRVSFDIEFDERKGRGGKGWAGTVTAGARQGRPSGRETLGEPSNAPGSVGGTTMGYGPKFPGLSGITTKPVMESVWCLGMGLPVPAAFANSNQQLRAAKVREK